MPNLPNHLFASDSGELFDTRNPQWSKSPLRAVYRKTYGTINNAAEFKATIRAGAYAWPGGYQMFLICDDGGALCYSCGEKEARQIIPAIANKERGGWRVVAADINYEDSSLYCDHCSNAIPSSYGED